MSQECLYLQSNLGGLNITCIVYLQNLWAEIAPEDNKQPQPCLFLTVEYSHAGSEPNVSRRPPKASRLTSKICQFTLTGYFFSIFRTTSFLSEQPESWSVEILSWNISLMPFADCNQPITTISPSLIYQALTTNGGEILGSKLDFRIYSCPSTSGQVHFWTAPLRSGMLSCKKRKPHFKVFTSNLSVAHCLLCWKSNQQLFCFSYRIPAVIFY